ncbi:MAG: phage holin family protein [Candidatus Izemoplasmatales bacterium]
MTIWEKIQGLIYSLLLFLNIDMNMFAGVIGLMILDTVMGGLKSTFIKGMEFDFKIMYLGLIVKSLMLLIPMATAIVSFTLGFEEYEWALQYIFRAIIVSEFISIITNFLSIKKRKNIKNPDILSMFLNFLKEKLINSVKKIDNK